MSLRGAVVLKRSGLSQFALWTFFVCGGRDNAEMYADDGGLILENCGDGKLDLGEQCDGTVFGPVRTCDAALSTPGGGTVSCYPKGDPRQCTLDVSNCDAVKGQGGG